MEPELMWWFLGMVLFINALTYGGVSMLYFRDKHRVLPPKRAAVELARVSPFSIGTEDDGAGDDESDGDRRRLDRAA